MFDDDAEKVKPVMGYIRDLEGKVRQLRAREGLLNTTVFFCGFLVGIVTGLLAGRLMH